MHDSLISLVKKFLGQRLTPGRPLLLGFSGGPDSLALLHLLLECAPDLSLNLHLAHIDHGWRPESAQEAELLAQYAEKQKLPFHLHRLEDKSVSNLEAKGREERLKFFSEIYTKIDAQALLLAHQADDLAETILKKVLEGSHLLSLHGMKEVGQLDGMQIWRPLLSARKEELQTWLNDKGRLKGHLAIDDKTNYDPRFLRARMRIQIIPQLTESFGKEISANLIRLGNTLGELAAEIESEADLWLKNIQRGVLGSYLEIPETLSSLKKDALVKKYLNQEGILLSHESYDALLTHLEAGAANRIFISNGPKNKKIIVDRGILFIPSEGHSWTNWEYTFEPTSSILASASTWRDIWQGKAEVVLPQGDYELISPETTHLFPGGSPIKDWWQEHYVPAFLRPLIPVIGINGKVVHEFLTGKKISFSSCNSLYRICLKFKLINN